MAQSDTEVEQPRVLRLLKDDILFAEKDEDLHKYILQQHQTTAIQQAVTRAHHASRTKRRGRSKFIALSILIIVTALPILTGWTALQDLWSGASAVSDRPYLVHTQRVLQVESLRK